jgi:hypothetical protein
MKNNEKTILLVGLLGVVLGACSANVPVRNSTLPQGSNYYNGYDQFQYGRNYSNRAPVLQPIAPISVNAGRIAAIQLQASDPEGKSLQQYVLACAPELGGTQNSSTGAFQVRVPETLQTQDALCGAMVVDSGALNARQTVTLQIKGKSTGLGGTLLQYAMPEITRTLATVALPAFMKVFTPQGGETAAGKTGAEQLAAYTGSAGSGAGSTLDWDYLVKNAYSPTSQFDFLKTVDAWGSLDVSSFWNPSSAWDSSYDVSKIYSTNWDFLKLGSSGGSGSGSASSGLTFEKFWNASSISSVGGGFQYEPAADAPAWDWKQSFQIPTDSE